MADEFNNFYTGIGQKMREELETVHVNNVNNVNNRKVRKNDSTIFLFPTTKCEIESIIDKIPSKSGGWDDINVKVIKCIYKNISHVLSYVYNLSMTTAIWLGNLKGSYIVPIYKNGNKHSCTNYRPIALISNFEKVFEKIIYNRFYCFIEKNKLFSDKQFGFLKNKGTKDALNYLHLSLLP